MRPTPRRMSSEAFHPLPARQVPIATVPNPAARTLTWTLRAHTHTAPGDGEAGGDGLRSAGVCVVQP